jgi:hypothetical protein
MAPETRYCGGFSATNSWPTASKAIFIPFGIDRPFLATKISWISQTPSGNADTGIYDIRGNRLVSNGGFAAAITGAVQPVDITDTLLAPGYYFVALVFDNTSAIIRTVTPYAAVMATAGICEMASAYPLPSTATLVKVTTNQFPDICIHSKAVGI